MSVQGIGPNSSIFNKVRNNTQKPVENPQPQVEEEVVQQEEIVEDNATGTSEKKSHKARNWSIGLSAAAVLIGLGVAGRYGKLGPKIQKALGGTVEKDAGKAADSLTGSTKADDGIVEDVISAEEFEQIKNGPKIKSGGGKDTGKPAEPKIETPKQEPNPVPKKEEPKVETLKQEPNPAPKAEEPVVETPKAKAEPIGPTLSQAEKDAINAKIDRTLKIPQEMLTIKYPTVEEVKAMGFDLSKFELKGTPNSTKELLLNGKKFEAEYNAEGELSYIWHYSNDKELLSWVGINTDKSQTYIRNFVKYGENTHNYYYRPDGAFDFAGREINGSNYMYTGKGQLKELTIKNEDDIVLKDIDFFVGTDKPEQITYGADSYKRANACKVEKFDGKSPNPIEEIYIKDGKEYR